MFASLPAISPRSAPPLLGARHSIELLRRSSEHTAQLEHIGLVREYRGCQRSTSLSCILDGPFGVAESNQLQLTSRSVSNFEHFELRWVRFNIKQRVKALQ